MDPIRLSDRMIADDDLIITNKIKHDCAAPHGRLFQFLGMKNNKRVVREIASNTVVVGGAITALQNLTGAEATWQPTTLNDIYGVDATSTKAPILSLFGIGTGGSNLDFGSVIAPNIKQRDVITPIPIRYNNSITDEDAGKYFMKVPNSDGITNSWYLKQFTTTPVIKSCWKNAVAAGEDGTEILSEIYNSPSTEGIETFTEFQIDLNAKDGREYFESTGEMSMARYNTIGFYTGSLNDAGTEYANVRLYSVVTFANRPLDMQSSGQYIYRLYSLI